MSFFLIRWVKNLFNTIKKEYQHLSDTEKQALQNGTGLVALINSMLDKTPAEIRLAIEQKFPNINEHVLESALYSLVNTLGLSVAGNSIEQSISAIKTKLASLHGKDWELISHTAASAIAVFFSPTETKVATIVSFIEWVYRTFIKKN